MQLPRKARLDHPTQVYWVEAVNHCNFDYVNQQIRDKYTNCLEVTSKTVDTMWVLRLGDFWNKDDDSLVYNDRFSKSGLLAYWRSLDASFEFNVKKRQDFLVRLQFRALKVKAGKQEDLRSSLSRKTDKEDKEDPLNQEEINCCDDPIPAFFKKCHQQDKYHWLNTHNNRFLLPHIKSKC